MNELVRSGVRWTATHGAMRLAIRARARGGNPDAQVLAAPDLRADPYSHYERLRTAAPFTDGALARAGSVGQALHPDVEKRTTDTCKQVTKSNASVFSGTDLASWPEDTGVDGITLVGYMTNNCVLGTAAAAEDLGIAVEVLSDATGAIDIVNEAGSASAQQVHETPMAVLNSNFAAVATTATWTGAVEQGQALPGSDLGTSAVQGRGAYDTTS